MIIGATNRPELIDTALLRPGRFDRRIQVDRPDRSGREKILRLHADTRPVSRRVDWGEVASHTAGLTAAELANIVNEGCLLAARRHRDRVAPEDVDEAVSRVLAGTRSARLMTDEEKELVGVHEAGHALLSVLLRGVQPPVPGVDRQPGRRLRPLPVVHRPTTARCSPSASSWPSSSSCMGGRAAEMKVFGQPSTRAEDDLEHAAALARRMVERLAMTGRFELAGRTDEGVRGNDEGEGGKEVRELLEKAEQAARTILGDNARDLRTIAETLVLKETLTAAELQEHRPRRRPRTVELIASNRRSSPGGCASAAGGAGRPAHWRPSLAGSRSKAAWRRHRGRRRMQAPTARSEAQEQDAALGLGGRGRRRRRRRGTAACRPSPSSPGAGRPGTGRR